MRIGTKPKLKFGFVGDLDRLFSEVSTGPYNCDWSVSEMLFENWYRIEDFFIKDLYRCILNDVAMPINMRLNIESTGFCQGLHPFP